MKRKKEKKKKQQYILRAFPAIHDCVPPVIFRIFFQAICRYWSNIYKFFCLVYFAFAWLVLKPQLPLIYILFDFFFFLFFFQYFSHTNLKYREKWAYIVSSFTCMNL